MLLDPTLGRRADGIVVPTQVPGVALNHPAMGVPPFMDTFTHTHTDMYIYIYTYMYAHNNDNDSNDNNDNDDNK